MNRVSECEMQIPIWSGILPRPGSHAAGSSGAGAHSPPGPPCGGQLRAPPRHTAPEREWHLEMFKLLGLGEWV